MNDEEINRRINEAHEKLRGTEIAKGTRAPGESLAYSNPDVIPFKEMKRLPYAEKVNELYGKVAGSGEKPFSKSAVGGPVTGLTEGVANWLSSAANVPLGWLDMYTEPTDLSEHLNYEPGLEGNLNRYGYMGGNVVGSIAPDILAYMAGGGLLKGMSGLPGMAARTALGGGVGYLGGEHGPGGRLGGAAMGTAGSLIGEAQAPRIAGRMEAQMNKEAAKLAPGYEKTLGKLDKVDFPHGSDSLFDLVGPNSKFKVTKGTEDAIYKFFQTGDAGDAKKAIAALKAEKRGLEVGKFKDPKNMVGERRARWTKIDEAIQDIEGGIADQFVKQGLLSEAGDLEKLDKAYAGKVGPYKFPELMDWIAGKSSTAKPVIDAVKGMAKGSKKLPGGELNAYEYLMKKNPEIFLNKMIPDITADRAIMASILTALLQPAPTNITNHGGD